MMDGRLGRFQKQVLPVLTAPSILAFLPAATLGASWLGGEKALVAVALLLPVLFGLAGAFRSRASDAPAHDSATGLIQRDGFNTLLSKTFKETGHDGIRSACFVIELRQNARQTQLPSQSDPDPIARQVSERIGGILRDRGTLARLGDRRFAICMAPSNTLDLETCIQMAGAIHSVAEEPVQVAGCNLYSSCAVGFCLRDQVPGDAPDRWLGAANDALSEVKQNGSSGIRAFSTELQRKYRTRRDLRNEAAAALENGQIQPWYQPQISTDTGKVTGFEALARWTHPDHGMIAPDMFIPVMEEAGLLERLSEVVLYHAMTALKAWDSAGLSIPRVGVNFAGEELRNPRLVERVKWEMDRFDLTPDRLSVEILESVVTNGPGDIVNRNIAGLAALGCRIDLDDFGTGHASIAAVRRIAVSRLKIDRSFVIKADRDAQQQRMIGAILTMAERLGLETLAEGVETVGEHALLAQLGCDHVQGFGIGRPMPFEQTIDWTTSHEAKLIHTPKIGRRTG